MNQMGNQLGIDRLENGLKDGGLPGQWRTNSERGSLVGMDPLFHRMMGGCQVALRSARASGGQAGESAS